MTTQSVIFDAATECRKSFTKCQTVDLLMENEWAENRLADFNLWDSGIGASVRSRASLDARLALKIDAQNIVAGLLWTLNAAIGKCIMYAQANIPQSDTIRPEGVGESEEEDDRRGRSDTPSPLRPSQRAFSPWSDDTSSDAQPYEAPYPTTNSIVSENMRNVDKMLDQLVRIAIAIRQSGTSSRLQRADKMLQLDDHKDLRSYLIAVMFSQKQLHGKNPFSPEQVDLFTCGLTAVQFRLIDCNLKRRNRFLYAQRHSKALDGQSSRDTLSGENVLQHTEPHYHPQLNPQKPLIVVSEQPSRSAKLTEQGGDVSVRTGTSASRVTDQFLLPQNPISSQASTTQFSTALMEIDYPHPPKTNPETLLFRCPCCCQTLPVNMLEKTRWRKHLAEDLCPYTCILPDCSKPYNLYNTKEAWIKHLREDHRGVEYWICFACIDALQFKEERSFEEHISLVHHGTISEDQIAIFMSSCKQSVPAEIDSCPLCTWSTSEGEERDKGAMIEHIAKELHAFSLRSLPWNDDNGQESEWQIYESSEKVSEWLVSNELCKSPSIEKSPLDRKVSVSNDMYFQHNPYFADTSESTNSSEHGSDNSREKALKELKDKQGSSIFESTAGEDEPLCQERPETPSQPLQLIPFRRDPNFVSRADILDQISMRCLKPAGRVALLGLGGVGKSQLAIEFAHRIAEARSDIWVFWIHAATQVRVEEGFKTIANAVKLAGRDQPEANIPLLVQNWLSNEPNGRWIIILDSADNSEVLYSSNQSSHDPRPLAAYLPQSRNGSILLTTRNRNVAFKLTAGYKDIIEIGPMTEADALALLEKSMGSPMDAHLAEDLVKALECIPLAISQAAAYVQARKPRSSIEKYLMEFRKSERRSMKLLEYEGNDIGRDGEASNAVLRTWTISFEYIRSQQRSAADLLSLMSFFDRQGIPEWVLKNSQDKTKSLGSEDGDRSSSESETGNDSNSDIGGRFEEDISLLRNYCLIATKEETNKFEMHRLVQLSIKNWLKAFGLNETFMQQYIKLISALFPTGEYENWEICRDLFAHVQVAIDYQPNDDTIEDWATLLYNGGVYAYSQGRYSIAEQMAGKAKKAREKRLGKDDVLTLQCISLLASILSDKGQWEEAEKLQLQVMETCKTKLGANHPDTLKSIGSLSSTYWKQGRWDDAKTLQLQVMEIQKTQLGADHPETLIHMRNLATTYLSQGRFSEAEKLQVQVMEIYKAKFGTDHPDTIISISNLALTYRSQGRWYEAEKLQLQVLETRKIMLGADHPDTLFSMSNLASTYWNQGRQYEAEKLEVQVLETRKMMLGADHPDTLTSMSNLASTYWNQGRGYEAEKLEVQVLEARKVKLGADHPDTLTSMSNLASTYWNQGQWYKAEKLQLEVLETRKVKLGADHPDTLTSMSNLTSTYWNQGRWDEAEKLQLQVLEIRKMILGADHPDTLTSISSLAHIWKDQGRHEKALAIMKDCLQARQRVLGQQHPYTLKCSDTVEKWSQNSDQSK